MHNAYRSITYLKYLKTDNCIRKRHKRVIKFTGSNLIPYQKNIVLGQLGPKKRSQF